MVSLPHAHAESAADNIRGWANKSLAIIETQLFIINIHIFTIASDTTTSVCSQNNSEISLIRNQNLLSNLSLRLICASLFK